MANGTTRNALAQIALRKGSGNEEMSAEMAILAKGRGNRIPLKAGASEHNHSVDKLRSDM